MRTIIKDAEPQSLAIHRQKPHSDYDNYPEKDDLRSALVIEQRGLCCYCMGRLRNGSDAMKIEHWQCQSQYPDEQLNYRNMLGACLGGEKLPPDLQHCDTKKGDSELKWNPANPRHYIEKKLRYEPDGSIRSDDDEFNAQLEMVLNLNLAFLKNNRRNALDAVLDWWKHEKNGRHGPVPRSRIEQKRNKLVDGTCELKPYYQVAVWWLDQKLARMQA